MVKKQQPRDFSAPLSGTQHPSSHATFVDILQHRAMTTPQKVLYAFIKDTQPGTPSELTYQALFELARGVAAHLQHHQLKGERVLLLFRSNAFFIIGFLGCLLAGVIAVPTAIPRRDLLGDRLKRIVADCTAHGIISDVENILENAVDYGMNQPIFFNIASLFARDELVNYGKAWQMPDVCSKDLAFIQYTSGSTGSPKGVMVSHGNLMENSEVIYQAFENYSNVRALVALPLFHDMGLIGGVLQPLYADFIMHFITPAQFVQKPILWLKLISEYGITLSGGPNFMYDLVANIPDDQLGELHLAHWSVAFCGAEPVRPKTVMRFTEKFSPYGFKPEAFFTCYGMAEATLFITGHIRETAQHFEHKIGDTTLQMGCGQTGVKTEVRIVDPQTFDILPDGQEGEIWVRSTSVAQGYWKNSAATEQIFHAHLLESHTYPYQRSYLRTGDLGYLKSGELFVSGRLKDLIILNGKNYAPHDIEMIAENSHIAIALSGCAAFSVPYKEQEALVVVCEVKRMYRYREEEWPKIKEAIRLAITSHHGVPVEDIVLLMPGTLPRTSSGKVRRKQCQIDYLNNTLNRVALPDSHAQ